METRDIALIKALSNGAGGASYTLPIASSTQLGGVQPAAKTESMTQAVGVDAGGALWTEPGGYEDTVLFEITTTEEVSLIKSASLAELGIVDNLDDDFIFIYASIVPPVDSSFTANGKLNQLGLFNGAGWYPGYFMPQNLGDIVPKCGSSYNGRFSVILTPLNPMDHHREVLGDYQKTQYTTNVINAISIGISKETVGENAANFFISLSTNTAFGAGTYLKMVSRRYL